LHQGRHLLDTRLDERRFRQRRAHRVQRLQAVPRDTKHDFIVGTEPPGARQRQRRRRGHTAGGLGEHTGVFGEEPDAVHERGVAHGGRPATRLAHGAGGEHSVCRAADREDRKSTRLNSSHVAISYAVLCLKKKKSCYFLFPMPTASSPPPHLPPWLHGCRLSHYPTSSIPHTFVADPSSPKLMGCAAHTRPS